MSKLLKAATLSLATATTITAIVGCNVGEPAPFDPRTLGESERLSSRDTRTYPMHPLPTTLQSPYLSEAPKPANPPSTGPSLGTEPQVRMTLQEIVHRAVINSNDIKVAAYQPAIDQTRVIEAEARFDPTFFANTQVQRIIKATPYNIAGAQTQVESGTNFSVQKETDYTASIGVRQQLESGGSIELRNQTQLTYNPQLLNTSTFGTNFGHNPAIENEWVMQITQPLLRDFGNEINRARIVINRNNQRISLLDFRKQLEETIADMEKTYWDLVQAETVVKIQEDLVSETIDMARDLVGRRGPGGDVSRLQISQTEAQLDTRRTQLTRAKQRVKDLSDQLKRDMNDPEFAVSGPIIVLPASPPLEEQVHFDPKDVIDTALANRFELGEQQLRVDSATTALKVGKNNLLPSLNAAGSISVQGLGPNTADVLENQLQRDYVSWSFGVEYEIPIGNRAARATYQRALLQRAQAIASYAAAISTVTFDCSTAIRDVQISWEALSTDRQAVFSSADALSAVDERYLREPRTPELLQLRLQFQDTYAQARRDEANSLASYNQALAKLELAKGTLLQYNNVIMQEDMIPYERKWLAAK
jgi:outer membrane protein TolC